MDEIFSDDDFSDDDTDFAQWTTMWSFQPRVSSHMNLNPVIWPEILAVRNRWSRSSTAYDYLSSSRSEPDLNERRDVGESFMWRLHLYKKSVSVITENNLVDMLS